MFPTVAEWGILLPIPKGYYMSGSEIRDLLEYLSKKWVLQ